MVAENQAPEDDRSSLERQGADELQALMRQRLELDRQIEGFRRDVTVMFTDLRGSTAVYDEKGDVHGRLLIQQHNSILFPIIERRDGQVLKTIGDAIMAYFEQPGMAVEAACEMQRELAKYNHGRSEEEQIHIRIGINSGKALVEEEDVYGDVVNVASRLVDLCGEDQILISRNTFEAVDPYLRNLSQPHAPTRLRGKTRSMQVFEVAWEEGMQVSQPQSFGRTLDLRLSRSNGRMRVALEERGIEPTTLTRYQDRAIDVAEVEASCREVVQILKRANRMGGGTSATLRDLERVGKRLYDQLFPQEVKKSLLESEADHLCIQMDDQLVQVPWELLFDGKEFLCERFSVGRLVQTAQEIKGRPRPAPLKANLLILSDPQGDLPSAAYEGDAVQKAFGDSLRMEVKRKNGRISRKQVVDELDRADIVHFCGHADYTLENPSESGWILADGKLTAGYVADQMAGGAQPFPSVVFSNACQTAKTDAWSANEENKIYGLANAFLIAGVQHFIGTFWEVMDTPSSELAVSFYRYLTHGEAIGKALQLARREMMGRFGKENLIWASYMLYGDPSRGFFGIPEKPPAVAVQEKVAEEAGEPVGVGDGKTERLEASALRQGRYIPEEGRRPPWLPVALGAVVAFAIIVAFVIGRSATRTDYDRAYALLASGQIDQAAGIFAGLEEGDHAPLMGAEGLAAVALARGDSEEALRRAIEVTKAEPGWLYPRVIGAQALMMMGEFEKARQYLEEALDNQNGRRWQQARAWNLMGRAYAAENDVAGARRAYDKALALSQGEKKERAAVLSNLGVLERRTGHAAAALSALTQAGSLDPGNRRIAALTASTNAYRSFLSSEEGRRRLEELSEAIKEGRAEGRLTVPEDDWQSAPRDVALIGLIPTGPVGVGDGEVEILNFELAVLLGSARGFEVVEREAFDALLAEQEIAASELADQRLAVRAGRLLNAHMILLGSLIQSGTQTTALLRAIETETSRVAALVRVTSDQGVFGLAEALREELIPQLESGFPIRGTIVEDEEGVLSLDIGRAHGLAPGDRLFVLAKGAEEMVRGAESSEPYRVAEIEVTGVEPMGGKARLVSGEVEAGLRVTSY